GQELSRDISPIEAGLKFAVKVNKPVDFIGKEALKKQIEEGTNRKLIGIEMIDKGIPRTGYEVYYNNEKIGYITSGTKSPSMQKNIGLDLVKSEYNEEETKLFVQVRKRKLKDVVIKTPYYKK